MLVAVLTSVEEQQVGQIAPAHLAVDLVAVGRPHRHVLEPRLVRSGGAGGVGGEHGPVVVVDDLVVVPDRHQGVGRVRRLDVGVATVEPVLRAVLVEGVDVVGGLVAHLAQQLDRDRLVDVVAQEQHGIQVLRGDVAPGAVVAAGVGLAGAERQLERGRAGRTAAAGCGPVRPAR